MTLSKDLSFNSAIDSARIFATCWLPDHPKANVLLIHGYGEHHGRYRHVIEALVSAGYAVFALDHRGHGKSEGLRAHVDNFDHFIADIHHLRQRIDGDYGGRPLFILGHSMGSLLTLTYAARHGLGLAGAVSSGCPLNSAETVSPLIVFAAKVLTWFVPKMALAETVPLTTLSRDPAVLRAFEDDPLNYHGKMRVRIGTEIDRTINWLKAHLDRLTMPLLIVHGEADAVTPVSGSRLVYERATAQDKTIRTYPGLFHEIFNEPEREQVLSDVISWLNAHSTST